jgi:hypothetical protein
VNSTDPVGARGRFLSSIARASTERDQPHRLCGACVQALPVQRAGIAVRTADSGLEVLCASDEVAERLEWAQVTFGEGPGVEAVDGGGPVIVLDIAAQDARWPHFAREATQSGVGAMCALPLQVGAIRVGVLDLYRNAPSRQGTREFAEALAVADALTMLLLAGWMDSKHFARPLSPWWDQSAGTREVHQATGMITARLGVDAREAYVCLQGYAFAQGRLLDDVAHDVVHHSLRFDDDRDPG